MVYYSVWFAVVALSFFACVDVIDGETESCGCGSDKLTRSSTNKVHNSNSNNGVASDSNLKSTLSIINKKMVLIKGGKGVVGTDKPILKNDGESPLRKVIVSTFYLDIFEVSNDDYRLFVEDTHYVTESERFGWSFVFESAIPDEIKKNITQAVLGAEWWLPVNGSYWRNPEGPDTDVFATNRGDHPVVQVSWNDAVRYCEWRGGRLPTEAEWEYAAKGPEHANSQESPTRYPWGKELRPNKQHRANIYQGVFPVQNLAEDGFEFISPVHALGPQNSFGLYNMIGNVWEWVHDWHSKHHEEQSSETVLVDPQGPPHGTERVKKGGSFLCHKSFCYRYRTVARFPSTPDSATYNVGFRCAMDEPQYHESMGSTESQNARDGVNSAHAGGGGSDNTSVDAHNDL